MSRPTEIMLVAIAQSTRCLMSKKPVSRRRRASATLCVGTREVSSTTSENVLRLWNSGGPSPTLARLPKSFSELLTSSSRMRRQPPSSRRLLK